MSLEDNIGRGLARSFESPNLTRTHLQFCLMNNDNWRIFILESPNQEIEKHVAATNLSLVVDIFPSGAVVL